MRKLLRTAGNKIVNLSCSAMAAGHFVSTSIADACAHAESAMMKRRYGAVPEETRSNRYLKTHETQVSILNKMTEFKIKLREAHKQASSVLAAADADGEFQMLNIHSINSNLYGPEPYVTQDSHE